MLSSTVTSYKSLFSEWINNSFVDYYGCHCSVRVWQLSYQLWPAITISYLFLLILQQNSHGCMIHGVLYKVHTFQQLTTASALLLGAECYSVIKSIVECASVKTSLCWVGECNKVHNCSMSLLLGQRLWPPLMLQGGESGKQFLKYFQALWKVFEILGNLRLP